MHPSTVIFVVVSNGPFLSFGTLHVYKVEEFLNYNKCLPGIGCIYVSFYI